MKSEVNIPETNEAYNKMTYWFFSFPYRETNLNELTKELKISKTTANKIINRLVKENFISKKIIGKNWVLKNNPEHNYNKTKKITYNLELIYNSGIIEEINKTITPKSIILFGSYRKGDDTEKSDIDIAVEIAGTKKFEIKELSQFKKFGYRKNVPVNLHLFSRDEININLFSNISNGIVLDGFLEVKK